MKKEQFDQMLAQASKDVQALNREIARICPKPEELSTKSVKERIRQDKNPLMNKLESEWFEKLKTFFPSRIIRPQSLRFRLANGLWYKPDFTSIDMKMAWEVKGPFAHRGGFENLKMAAACYTEWKWRLVWKENGRWMDQEILP